MARLRSVTDNEAYSEQTKLGHHIIVVPEMLTDVRSRINTVSLSFSLTMFSLRYRQKSLYFKRNQTHPGSGRGVGDVRSQF